MSPSQTSLPPAVARFVAALNAFDLDGLMATFTEDAFVNDNHREFWGKDAIRQFAARELTGDHVTMAVTDVRRHYDMIAVAAKVDGDYDKTNLPTPLILSFYFSLMGDRIASLVIIFNKPRSPQVSPNPESQAQLWWLPHEAGPIAEKGVSSVKLALAPTLLEVVSVGLT
ncbi:MAG: YybH family protein [Stellaceae bacterium]